MKPVPLHFLTALAGAALGWAFSSSTDGTGLGPRIAAAPGKRPAGFHGAPAATWQAQLSAVRAVPGARSGHAWEKWAFSIPDADIPAAIAKLNPRADFNALRYLYARWARLDPAAAWASFRQSEIPEKVSHFYQHEDEDRPAPGLGQSTLSNSPRSLIASRMLVSMEAKDPEYAKALATRLANKNGDDARDVPVSSYLFSEVERLTGRKAEREKQKPADAAAAAEALPAGDAGRSKAISEAARRWLNDDPNAACAWILKLPPEELRGFTSENYYYGIRRARPQDGAQVGAAMLAASGGGVLSIKEVMNRGNFTPLGNGNMVQATLVAAAKWAQQDTAGAQAWLGSLPESDLKSAIAGSIAGAMTRQNASAALAILNNTGGDQELAVTTFVRGWTNTDVRAALAWSEKIEDSALRDQARSTIATELLGSDTTLAAATAVGLSDPAARRALFNSISQTLSWNPAALESLQHQFPSPEWTAPAR